jgi:hypothetical protein
LESPLQFLDQELASGYFVFPFVVQEQQEDFAGVFVDRVVNPLAAGLADVAATVLAAGFVDGQGQILKRRHALAHQFRREFQLGFQPGRVVFNLAVGLPIASQEQAVKGSVPRIRRASSLAASQRDENMGMCGTDPVTYVIIDVRQK